MKMFSVEMTLEEINELGRIVDRERKDLRSEIHHTDDFDFRNILKSRDRLLQANQVTVYVPLDQAPDVTGFFARMATAVLGDPNRPLREKRQVVREVACLNLQTIFSADISSQALKQSLRQTQDLVGVLGGDPQLLKNMGDLLRSDSDLFNHCVNVCMIAMAFGRFLKLPEQIGRAHV